MNPQLLVLSTWNILHCHMDKTQVVNLWSRLSCIVFYYLGHRFPGWLLYVGKMGTTSGTDKIGINITSWYVYVKQYILTITITHDVRRLLTCFFLGFSCWYVHEQLPIHAQVHLSMTLGWSYTFYLASSCVWLSKKMENGA